METALQVYNLAKKYSPETGVLGISFMVAPGEVVGFIGPNGAGKTTTLRSIMGFIRPDAGSVSMFGNNMLEEDSRLMGLSHVGYVPAEPRQRGPYSSAELFRYTAALHNQPKALKSAHALAKRLDLNLKQPLLKLSTGNQRKAWLIRALMLKPDLLLLDEPTSGLDPLIQQRVLEVLEEQAKNGTSILLSSHMLSEVQRICDRIIMIKQGKIIMNERTQEILRRARRRLRLFDPPAKLVAQMESLDTTAEIRPYGEEVHVYTTDPKEILKMLDSHQIYDFYLEQPTLEEMFYTYYV